MAFVDFYSVDYSRTVMDAFGKAKRIIHILAFCVIWFSGLFDLIVSDSFVSSGWQLDLRDAEGLS